MGADALASGEQDRVAVASVILPLTTPTNCVSILHMVSAQYSEKQGVMEECLPGRIRYCTCTCIISGNFTHIYLSMSKSIFSHGLCTCSVVH